MSNGQEDVSSQPLVIIRRRRNTDEPHHGGVWKIAYADFMTAMMAFFLVMWLINAADKKTIVQVAAYFNPMRLTDRYAAPKGLEDLTETATKPTEERGKKGFEKQVINSQQKQEAEQESKERTGDAMDEAAQKSSAAAGGKSTEAQKEQALFDNPGDLLEKLADEARANSPTTASSPADGNISDPFDRTNRRAGKSQDTLKPAQQPATAAPPPSGAKAVTANNSKPPSQETAKQTPPVPQAANQLDKPKQQDVVAKQTPAALDQTKTEEKQEEKKEEKKHDKDKDEQAKKLEDQITSAISNISKDLPQVEVKATPEGVLISLTDDAHFGMFEVGSAKPRPELVLVMDKIGNVLQAQPGTIVVRGHTDSRAYKSGNYDNWRLSAARAQMAYYMLVRGGVPETRVTAIEGRADRDPKIPSDTLAAPNRRIDILVKEDQK
ncbi:MotB family protein [Hyphomicrobium facile]|uniref:Chemotaxis protein MotB n=1 Tax=Hyphomicrobium facile TaxID=51670 RepID=A0A1I7NRE3_9HYPH|nr:MotB family protein [Hyphomicrobium facile]SFV37229.1 chemotaxis protein MotB [Hyphomicrobium facile]